MPSSRQTAVESKDYPDFFDRSDGILDNHEGKRCASLTHTDSTLDKNRHNRMPQYLNNFLLHSYALDDCMWTGIICKLITARNALEAACSLKNILEIVANIVKPF